MCDHISLLSQSFSLSMEECWADARRLVAQLCLNTAARVDMWDDDMGGEYRHVSMSWSKLGVYCDVRPTPPWESVYRVEQVVYTNDCFSSSPMFTNNFAEAKAVLETLLRETT